MVGFEIISWLGMVLSITASIIRALNIGYYKQTYMMSFISSAILVYNAYHLKSIQLIILNTFHLFICMTGIYNWSKK